jgi:hypothetical protein
VSDQTNKINHHVFHEFYRRIKSFPPDDSGDGGGSSGGGINIFPLFPYSLSTQYLYNRYPVKTSHTSIGNLAIFGAASDLNQTPVEFETEEDALKFYKINYNMFYNMFSRFDEEEYNKLKGENICKNYFKIPSSLLYKHFSYFNGMIKNLKFQFKHEVDVNGTFEFHNDCQCSSSSSSSSSSESSGPDSGCCHNESHPNFPCFAESAFLLDRLLSPNSFTSLSERIDFGLKPFTKIDGPEITDIDFLFENNSSSSSFFYDLSSSSSSDNFVDTYFELKSLNNPIFLNVEEEEEENKCCYCPPCEMIFSEDEEIRERAAQYICKNTFNAKLTLTVDYDGSKIYEDQSLENRVPSYNHIRCINFDWSSDSEDPASDLLDLKSNNVFSDICAGSVYKDNWILNENWKTKYFPTNLRTRFAKNSTLINDPILDNNFIETQIRINSYNMSSDVKTALEQQKKEKKSDKIGDYSYKITGNSEENTGKVLFSAPGLKIILLLDQIFYIKSTDEFLCFILLDVEHEESVGFRANRYRDKLDEYEILPEVGGLGMSDINDFGRGTRKKVYTTDDRINLCKVENTDCRSCSQGNSNNEIFTKYNIPIKIGNFETSFEVFAKKDNEDKIDIKRDGNIESNLCIGGFIDPAPKDELCTTFKVVKKYTSDFKIEIIGWEKDSFSKTNVYPPKIEL